MTPGIEHRLRNAANEIRAALPSQQRIAEVGAEILKLNGEREKARERLEDSLSDGHDSPAERKKIATLASQIDVAEAVARGLARKQISEIDQELERRAAEAVAQAPIATAAFQTVRARREEVYAELTRLDHEVMVANNAANNAGMNVISSAELVAAYREANHDELVRAKERGTGVAA